MWVENHNAKSSESGTASVEGKKSEALDISQGAVFKTLRRKLDVENDRHDAEVVISKLNIHGQS